MPEQARISPANVFVVDLVLGAIYTTLAYAALGPSWVMEARGASDTLQWMAFGAGLAFLAVLFWLLSLARKRLKRVATRLEAVYAYAKQRRDLSLATERLSLFESICAWLILAAILLVLIVPSVVLVRYAVRNFDWVHTTEGTIVLFLPGLVLGPLLLASFRVAFYAGVNIAAFITGGRPR
jgi:hypothetical protein